jgi:hypothetical protein
MKINFILIFLILMIAGCKSNSTKAVVLEEAQGANTLLPDSSLAKFSSLHSFSMSDGSSLIALYDVKRHAELFFDTDGKELLRVTLHFPDSLDENDPQLFTEPINVDSILAIWPSMKTIFLFNGKGEIIRCNNRFE